MVVASSQLVVVIISLNELIMSAGNKQTSNFEWCTVAAKVLTLSTVHYAAGYWQYSGRISQQLSPTTQ